MAMEKYIAIGSIALYTIFAAEMITLFNFMIQATEADFFRDPAAKVLQFISISASTWFGSNWYFIYACKKIWFKASGFNYNCRRNCIASRYALYKYNVRAT